MWTTPRKTYPAPSPNEESGPLTEFTPLTGYEPKLLDDFHHSETAEIISRDESSDKDTVPSQLFDAEHDDETIGKALTSPLFIQEREDQRTEDKLITPVEKVCCQLSPFLRVTQEEGDPCMNLVCQVQASEKNQVAKCNETIRILLERQKKQILDDFTAEIQKHEFQADYDRRDIQELSGIIESQQREIEHALASDEQLRRDQLLLHEQLSEQNRDLREAHIKSLHEMEELKRVQELRIDDFSRR